MRGSDALRPELLLLKAEGKKTMLAGSSKVKKSGMFDREIERKRERVLVCCWRKTL